ncbi:hypothetical protein Cgig2_005957 [Carnegiea gigantea]|uniref:Uncharacterized protein n=1 Tax=Carnegiea gigantea TaxID=171969 RepID=A0A9Q1QLH6_9CARY|nr:hypothetical protein Cgig2_005957 [Carnegiea gigantea]
MRTGLGRNGPGYGAPMVESGFSSITLQSGLPTRIWDSSALLVLVLLPGSAMEKFLDEHHGMMEDTRLPPRRKYASSLRLELLCDSIALLHLHHFYREKERFLACSHQYPSSFQASVPVAPHYPRHFPPVGDRHWRRQVGCSGQCRGSPEVVGVGHGMFQAKHSTSDDSRVPSQAPSCGSFMEDDEEFNSSLRTFDSALEIDI